MTHIINTADDLSECELTIFDLGDGQIELRDTRTDAGDDEGYGTIAYFSREVDAEEYAKSKNGKI